MWLTGLLVNGTPNLSYCGVECPPMQTKGWWSRQLIQQTVVCVLHRPIEPSSFEAVLVSDVVRIACMPHPPDNTLFKWVIEFYVIWSFWNALDLFECDKHG